MGNNTGEKKTPSLSRQKKILFSIILFSLPFLIIGVLELGLRIINYGTKLDLFIKSSEFPGYYEVNRDVATRFFSKNKGTEPSNDVFLINKPDTAYRIFVMGCSTTRGFPYNMGTTFSRILNYRLQDAFPNKKIEVVNTSMASVNSFTQADFINEIIAQKPDAILIYTGHNEFYGALGVGSVENGGNLRWLKKLHLSLIQFRTYQLTQKIIAWVMKVISPEVDPNVTGTLMERIVKDKAIEYKSDNYNIAINDFKLNMSEVLQKARDKNIPVLFGDVVSNVHSLKPFKSVPSKTQPLADDIFILANELEKKGLYDSARSCYYLAKDLDGIRFRAPEDINLAIYEISKTYNAHIVQVKKQFEQKSPNNLIGNNLMVEHLHPNVEGYFLMADIFFNAMRENKLISDNWDTSLIKPSSYYRSVWGFTTLDSLIADIKVKSLMAGWPFKPEKVKNKFIYEYKPKNFIDTLAIRSVVYKNVTLIGVHEELAKYFMRQGKYSDAYNEYNSLIRCYPYITEFYLEAARFASLANEHTNCIELLLSCPVRENSFLVNIQIGKLYQKIKVPKKAIAFYEQAQRVIKPTDNKELLLTSLYSAYIEAEDKKKAMYVLAQIKEIDPNFNPSTILTKREVIVTVNKESKELIDNALVLAKSKKFDEALELLFKAQKIKETSYGNQIIGSILFEKNDPDALTYLLKAYNDTPNEPSLLTNIVVLYIMNKDYKSAYKFLKELKLVSNETPKIKKLEEIILKNLNNVQVKF
jgi:tetratricopeptide (TPR) repeat protein